MHNPLVSVLIRSTGRPELTQALESVRRQTYPHLETHVLDVTGKGMLDVSHRFRRLVFMNADRPVQRAEAANLLLNAAQGEFALFLDDDDWIDKSHVSRLVSRLCADPCAVAAYSGVSCVVVDASHPDGWRETRRYDDAYDPTRLIVENYMPIHAVLFRLSLCRGGNCVLFDPQFDLFEDWDFWLQLSQHGSFLHVPGISAYYRIHGSSGTGVRIDIELEAYAVDSLKKILDKWRDRWTLDQLKNLIGYARHVNPLQIKVSQLEEENTQKTWALKKVNHESEAALSELAVCKKQLEDAQKHLIDTELAYKSSISWRITRPLRWVSSFRHVDFMKLMRVKFLSLVFSKILNAADSIYRIKMLAAVWRRVPASMKRRLRGFLLRQSIEKRTQPRRGRRLDKSFEKPPRVSIIIPVYNHAAFLEKSIRSALCQTWPDIEIIVVDDASTDPLVKEILLNFSDQPRLTILRNETNLGICHTQNRALIASTGDIIAFLDCDDYLDGEAIHRCIQSWNDDTVYLHTGRINIDQHGREINRINFLELPRVDYFQENLKAMYATHLKLIRRDVFSRVGLFDPRFDSAQDYEMLMRIAFHYPSTGFVHIPDFLYFHRIHSEQTTTYQNDKQAKLTQVVQSEARLRSSIREGVFDKFVSIIMLSYGKHSQTLSALLALKDTLRIPHEVILYDNGSTTETVEFIRQQIDGKFDGLRVVYGDRNLGPAQGRRVAMQYAMGPWYLIFDNDEIPEPGWIEELLVRALSQPGVGAVCCRVCFPDGKLQFSGGRVDPIGDEGNVIDLALYDRGSDFESLTTCQFRKVDWCPIGATLYTVNIAEYLHDGYPNAFEDAGVSFALKKRGLVLLNAPGALVWHEHITFQPLAEMRELYLKDRYNPQLMLKSLSSFYNENGLLIQDEYVWRENGLDRLSYSEIIEKLNSLKSKAMEF